MPGMNLNLGTSVVKREAKSIEEVDSRLVDTGWERTASILNGRVKYYQNAGINITAIQGPMGTVIVPSGPVRGAIFGKNAVRLGRTSSIGAGPSGASKDSQATPKATSDHGRDTLV